GWPASSRSKPRSSSASSLARPSRTRDRIPATTRLAVRDPASAERAIRSASHSGPSGSGSGIHLQQTPYTPPRRRLAASQAAAGRWPALTMEESVHNNDHVTGTSPATRRPWARAAAGLAAAGALLAAGATTASAAPAGYTQHHHSPAIRLV